MNKIVFGDVRSPAINTVLWSAHMLGFCGEGLRQKHNYHIYRTRLDN